MLSTSTAGVYGELDKVRVPLGFMVSQTKYEYAGVYGELGPFPLFINRYVRIIKYWCKICNSDNILIKTMYKVGLDNGNKGCK